MSRYCKLALCWLYARLSPRCWSPTWHLFALVFMLSAAGQSGIGIAAWNLLYAVSPEDERPLYVGAANSLLSLPSFAPILARAGLWTLSGTSLPLLSRWQLR